ncbi:type VI secretion system baseplate subunit TssG [Pseudoduganella namucuonensis]|uniref:Type VI secretion system protein ImpH n=1 Tax=Pseudoduganella namucuonensis TaxID=1035707 RepID=A0A1I7LVF8_9BURK|nr:type VI secretion system baseplate subunit TssG [Pseudoduganella namucuonensis]SFV13649.1 type VI secretion system protein ImpH [Pseudoduganella namucuonensis]
MSTTERIAGTGVIGRLLEEPHCFEFFQAVRLLEMLHASRPGKLRYRNRMSMAFPPSQLEAIEQGGEGDGESTVTLTPAFMGLLGANGALPPQYTERIAEYEQREGDPGPRAFIDMLSQRALSMFYEAWTRHRPECLPDGFLPMLAALAGARPATDGVIQEETRARYAAQSRGRAVPPAALAGVLSEYFGVPFQVEQLVPTWDKLPPRHQAQLGVANVDLDAGVLLGERMHRCDTLARIRIGPLGREDFERFLPRQECAVALKSMLGLFCGASLTYEIRVVLRAGDVRGVGLCRDEASGGARLGVNAFLLDGPSERDRDDATYFIKP